MIVGGLGTEQEAAEIRIRAERKAGEFLGQMEKAKGKRTDLELGFTLKLSDPTLSDLDIDKNESFRWQTIAAIPEPEFEERIRQRREKGESKADAGNRTQRCFELMRLA